jgi:hypothetical protein
MDKNYHYLPVSFRELWSRYGLIYIPFISLAVASQRSFLITIFWYWLVCGILFWLEYKGTYFLIKDGKLIGYASFLHGRDIPLTKIKSLTVGQSEVELFHPHGLKIIFEDDSGKMSHRVLTFHRFDVSEIEKFMHGLQAANPNITIYDELYKWIEKIKEKAKRKKTLTDYFGFCRKVSG